MQNQKKGFKMPHTYVILFFLIVLVAILTYIIPAGQFERYENEQGTSVVDPDSYTVIESNPTTIFELLQAIPRGLIAASSVVFFIFVVGGSFQIVTETGAIENGIKKLVYKLKDRGALMIPAILFVFSILGGTIGFAEETIVFVPLGIALAKALGYDALVGMSIVYLGAGVGFSSGFMNPFTVGVAQEVAELEMFSGMWLRLIAWAVLLVVTSIYVMRYAKKVKANPSLSLAGQIDTEAQSEVFDISKNVKLSVRDILILLTLVGGLGLIIWGVIEHGWYMVEISSIFLGIGLVSGVIGKMGPSKIAEVFIDGARGIALGALVVGVSRAVLVVMQDAMIIDTVVYHLANLVIGLPTTIAAVVMFLVQTCINFFIPSGSGQASVTMPIMAPLADIIGLTRQTAVLAFNFGDGFTNQILPTSGTLLANLMVAKVSYEKWVKYAGPLIIIWSCIAAAFMVFAVLVGYA